MLAGDTAVQWLARVAGSSSVDWVSIQGRHPSKAAHLLVLHSGLFQETVRDFEACTKSTLWTL